MNNGISARGLRSNEGEVVVLRVADWPQLTMTPDAALEMALALNEAVKELGYETIIKEIA